MGSFQSKFEVQFSGFGLRLDGNWALTGSRLQPQRQAPEGAAIQRAASPETRRPIADSSPLRIKCAVCENAFHPPIKVLRCGHSFCYRCLFHLQATWYNRDLFRCTQCRQMTEVAQGDCHRLPTNVELERLLEEMGILGPYETPSMHYRTLEPLTGEEPNESTNREWREVLTASGANRAVRVISNRQTRSDDTLANTSATFSMSQSAFAFENENSSGSSVSLLCPSSRMSSMPRAEESNLPYESLSISSNGDGASSSLGNTSASA